MKRFSPWLWLAASIVWLALLARPLGPLPALGPLLDLRAGIWQHDDFSWSDKKLPGLAQTVAIAVDTNGIPHIFAESERDLYIAQGYIMASQRLFQMDLSTRAVTGRLSELVGKKGLDIDRYFVTIGMRQSLLKVVNDNMSHEPTAKAVDAFTLGVNAYIQDLKDLPAEYKILGSAPKPFDPSRTFAMARALTYNLNGGSDDLDMSHIAQQISVEKILDLFPEFMPPEYSDYVLPGAWAKSKRAPETADLFKFQTHIKNFTHVIKPAKGNGSNNWVVGAKKSKTGHTILENDTHLGQTLPGIWFENQLSCPEFNVYGVSLPDVPGIVGGFNGATAWGPTNGTTDATDYYEVEFVDESSNKYLSNGIVKDPQVFSETISVTNGRDEVVDVVWTEFGPVIHREGKYGIVMNWTSYQPKLELFAIRSLYEAKDVKSCLKSFDNWNVPIQNFVCADADHIGIRHAGFVPKRNVGEGRFVEKAGSSQYALHVPIEDKYLLERIDPKESYFESANQRIVDETYPNYMGWRYEEPFRAMRIRRLLESQEKFSGEDMMRIQNDDYDMQAEFTLPYLLKAIDRGKLDEEQRKWIEALDKWDRTAKSNRVEPAIYKAWFLAVKREIFADEYSLPEHKRFFPQDIRVAWLLKRVSQNSADSDAQWVDDKRTSETENLSQVVTRAFNLAWAELQGKFGKSPDQWTWKRFINTRVDHVAKIPGFGSNQLAMDGAAESVRGNRGWHGAVYKFVIELGPEERAWMQTPGGPSGDPFSPNFEQNVEDWAAGKMRPVKRYKDLAAARADGLKVYEFTPETE